METENLGATPGASGSEPPQTPAGTPEPETKPAIVEPTAKVEIKEGKVTVDGKAFVAESDLIAAKKGLEGKLDAQQKAHDLAVDAAKLEVSTAQQEVATLNAKIMETEEARKTGAVSDEDAAKVKQDLEASIASIEKLTASTLEYRRALMVLRYGVAEDTIKDKTIPELDAFEEALKAVATAKGGAGPYAIGGGTGEAAPATDMERAAKVLESTPVRGVRNAEVAK